mmetsp:Transcript_9402/g.21819  ORF Transcript_9402/g.21819 Transcript_9402/m.21819 type:complete len:155 (+) Transcript_9402:405-869(+)
MVLESACCGGVCDGKGQRRLTSTTLRVRNNETNFSDVACAASHFSPRFTVDVLATLAILTLIAWLIYLIDPNLLTPTSESLTTKLSSRLHLASTQTRIFTTSLALRTWARLSSEAAWGCATLHHTDLSAAVGVVAQQLTTSWQSVLRVVNRTVG